VSGSDLNSAHGAENVLDDEGMCISSLQRDTNAYLDDEDNKNEERNVYVSYGKGLARITTWSYHDNDGLMIEGGGGRFTDFTK
jgi:hypothetical protein